MNDGSFRGNRVDCRPLDYINVVVMERTLDLGYTTVVMERTVDLLVLLLLLWKGL